MRHRLPPSLARTRRALATLAAAAGVALAGCGGSEEEAPPAEPPAQGPGPRVLGEREPTPTPVRARFEEQVRRLLTKRKLERRAIECALDELATTVTDTRLEQAAERIRKTGEVPKDVLEAAAAAGEACGSE